ncbi:MAG: hypothetical protein IKQ94_10765 [Bacteroidales bacterium]|nr:hypothetical protein [Bacteroidales bacterium]
MNGVRVLPQINGVVPGWASLRIVVGGVPVNGIKSIDYKDEQEIEAVYGIGQKAIGRGFGQIKHSGSIELERSEVESLRQASDTGRLQDLAPFDIIVQFVPVDSTVIATHKLLGCIIKDDEVSYKNEDTSNYTTFSLFITDIIWK